MVSVEIRAPDPAMIPHWDDLARRAEANVFMHPAALCAANTSGFARVHALLAWDDATPRKLIGFWALRERRVVPFVSYLATPPYEFCFVSNAMVDPTVGDDVMPAFLDAIASSALPNVIKLKYLDANDATHAAMMRALAARNGEVRTLSERERPFLSGEGDRKRSGSTGKKLRQDWNRLSSVGTVDILNERTVDGARAAFESFLDLEARSWKGQNGTALLSNDEDAAFTRGFIASLAAHDSASVALLCVDAKPIAAQVLLYAGAMAYTWKTAFDAEFAKYSPGALLIDKVSDELFAAGVGKVESCSADGSFMAQLWTGRRTTMDMLVDLSTTKSATFTLALFGERAYAWLREQRNRVRAINWPSLPRRKNLAATRS